MFRPTVATPDIKRKIDTRDLFINTPTQIYDFLLKIGNKPDDGHCWPKHVVYTY